MLISFAGGALKAAHGVAMHAVLVLPALAWLLARTRWPEGRRVYAMRFAVAAYAAVSAGVLMWSL